MRFWQRRFALALVSVLVSCGDPGGGAGVSAPDAPRATAVLRTMEIRIADRPDIDISVTTAPDRRVLRAEPPESLAGFEILEWQTLPVVREPRRWVHRQRVRLRALEIGRFEWPALRLTVVARDGTQTTLELAPIALEVGSIMDEHPNRTAPFGARDAPDPPRPAHASALASALALAAAVASLVLAATVFFVFARRRARTARARADAPPAPWSAALHEFDCAAELAHMPAAASHRAAAALHDYMGRRFRARTRMHTTEELAAAEPPYGATSSWPTFVELLRSFDELRFRPAADGPDDHRTAAFTSTLARARGFVETTTPPEGLR